MAQKSVNTVSSYNMCIYDIFTAYTKQEVTLGMKLVKI